MMFELVWGTFVPRNSEAVRNVEWTASSAEVGIVSH